MNETPKKKIYFHVGVSKTGTTFLQYRVFPKFKGIHYIQRTRYKKVKEIIDGSNFAKYLVSREFDQQLEREVKIFSSRFPETKPIIVFRRHDSYIASQYRRFIKNGFKNGFHDFFDLKNDGGFFKKQDLDYCRQIQILEKYFNQKPMVLIYEDLKNDTYVFIDNLAKQMDVSINHKKVNIKKKHASYSEKQLRAILFIGKYINMKNNRFFKNNIMHFIWSFYLNSIRYTTLFIAKYTPITIFKSDPLIPVEELKKIRDFYKNDWDRCLIYSEKHKR